MNGFVDLETCIDLCLYIFPLFIFVFAKKSSPNVNLQMKRDIELQKPVAYTSIRLGKRESDQKLKWKFIQKAKSYLIKVKYQISLSQWEVIVSKGFKKSNAMIESGVKCKALSYVIKFCGRSYMHISTIEMDHMIWC